MNETMRFYSFNLYIESTKRVLYTIRISIGSLHFTQLHHKTLNEIQFTCELSQGYYTVNRLSCGYLSWLNSNTIMKQLSIHSININELIFVEFVGNEQLILIEFTFEIYVRGVCCAFLAHTQPFNLVLCGWYLFNKMFNLADVCVNFEANK